MSDLTKLADLISEKQVYEQYRHIFADRELLEARKSGELEFYDLRKGIYYTESQLIAYLKKRKQKPCPNRPLVESESSSVSGPSRAAGSARRPDLKTITSTGTSPARTSEEDELIERALERQT